MKTLLTLLLCFAATAAQASDPAGRWEGGIQLPQGQLGILVELEAEDGGAWEGTIDIPAQGLRDFALSRVSVEGPKVHFEMDGVPGTPTFDGTLAESGESISGSFTQGPQSLTFSLKKAAEGEADPEPAAPRPAIPGDGPVGNWLGALEVGPAKLRLGLEIEAGADGTLTAALDSMDQGVVLPADRITFEEKALRFAIDRIAGRYEGTLNEDGSAFEGTWTQGGQSFPLTFDRVAEAPKLERPQEPQPPFPYSSREVTFRNEADGIELAGTLLLPPGDGPFPAVLFITGSGPQDRDEALMGHRPFLVIADHLAREGIASLRYDDRGVGGSSGDHMGSTVDDFADDADAGLRFLAAQPKIDSKAVGIVGHSEGGLTGPKVATQNRDVDFLVLLAPPGEHLQRLLRRQTEDMLRLNGISDDLIRRAVANQEDELKLVADPKLSREALVETLRERTAAQRKNFTEEELEFLGFNETAVEANIQQATTAWFRSLMREDPADSLSKIKVPVLALLAELDFQVPPKVNAPLVEKALAAAGNEDYEVKVLPGLNHLFQHAETGAISEYGTIEETFAPEALELVGSWILQRFSGTAP